MPLCSILFVSIWALLLGPDTAYAIGFTIATAAGLTAATAAGGVGLTGAGLLAGTAITGGLIAGGLQAAKSIFKTPKVESSYQPPAAVKEAEPSVAKAEAAAQEDIKKKRQAIARNKTIYTSPLGLSDSQKSGIALKTLTGV